MLYASSKDALRKALVGIATEIQGTDLSEVSYETVLEKVSRSTFYKAQMNFVGKNVYLFLSLFLLSLLSVRGLSFGIHSFAYSLVSHFLYKSPIYTHPH